jgi:2,3,4,5-tetrahydropyridine-2-carboxylate N-succinyltransferase
MTRKASKNEELKSTIESAFERRAELTPAEIEGSTRTAVELAIEGLESGKLRVAEPDGKGGWKVNEWLKKAVLLYFRASAPSTRTISASSACAWCRAPSRAAARTSARTWC